MRIVDNANMRRVVAEFAAEPNQRRSLEVLRTCMCGELLLDITGSEMRSGIPFSAGSQLQIRGGNGPDGGRALFAFTNQEQIGRLYPPNTRTQSLANPATGVLELARQQGDAWLYIDPAGPTCALSATEIDFALRNPRNEPLKAALSALHDGFTDRRSVVQMLRQDAPLCLAADDQTVPGKIGIRSVMMPDGSSALLGFTSAPEVVAYNPSDAAAALTTLQVLDKIRADGYSGIVINPAGPSIAIPLSELAAP